VLKYHFHAGYMPSLVSPMFVPHVFDRTNTLFSTPHLESILPLGRTGYKHSLADTCDARAQEIISKAQGKKVYVFWSGGIDSTTALVSLLKAGVNSSLCIVVTEESIQEYPEFYDRYIHGKLDIKLVKYKNEYGIPESVDKYLDNGIVVTGEIGDQMFGSDKYLSYDNPTKLLDPWENLLKSTKAFEKYEMFVAFCPIKIKTQKDFWWWFSYATKYNYVVFRMLRTSHKFKLENNVFHFFNTTFFNDWCVSTPVEERFYGSDIKNYKQPLKDYIYSFTKDSNYQKHKIKTGSLYNVYFDLNPFAKLKEWSSISVDGVIT
jgi:hypothetical protein